MKEKTNVNSFIHFFKLFGERGQKLNLRNQIFCVYNIVDKIMMILCVNFVSLVFQLNESDFTVLICLIISSTPFALHYCVLILDFVPVTSVGYAFNTLVF